MRQITQELQDVVRTNPKIKEVHFSADGRHFLNVFKLQPERDSEDWNLYGTGIKSHTQLIPGLNPDGVKEDIAIGDNRTLIVETLSREEVLSAKPKQTGKDIVSEIFNATDAEKAQILGALGLTSEMIAKLHSAPVATTPPPPPPPAPKGKTGTTPPGTPPPVED